MLTNLKLYAALGVAAVFGLAAWHYHAVIDDLDDARATTASAIVERDAAIQTANKNAIVTKRLQDRHQSSVAAPEAANAK